MFKHFLLFLKGALMGYSDEAIYYDDEAESIKQKIDDENLRRLKKARGEAYDRFLPLAQDLYGDIEGIFYYNDYWTWDLDYIKELHKKYGIGYSVVKVYYTKIYYHHNKWSERVKEKTGNYSVHISGDERSGYSGDVTADETTYTVEHQKLEVLGEDSAGDEIVFPHWKERTNEHSKDGIGCVNTLKRFDGFFESNSRELMSGKIFHSALNSVLSILFHLIGSALCLAGCFIGNEMLSIIFASISLGAMLFSFILFVRLMKRKVYEKKSLYFIASVGEYVIVPLTAAATIAKIYVPIIFVLGSYIVYPFFGFLIMFLISLFSIGTDLHFYRKKQHQVFEDNAFECYPYFKKHFKEIVVGRFFEKEKEKLEQKEKEKVPEKPKHEDFYLIKEDGKDDAKNSRIVGIIMKTMNVTLKYALKAAKGKYQITYTAASEIKKAFPGVVIYQYKK